MKIEWSNISSDLFKMPVAILVGVGVLLYLDWRFTIDTPFTHLTCTIPTTIYGKTVPVAEKEEHEDKGLNLVTMIES